MLKVQKNQRKLGDSAEATGVEPAKRSSRPAVFKTVYLTNGSTSTESLNFLLFSIFYTCDPDGTRTHITRCDRPVGNLCHHRAINLERMTRLELVYFDWQPKALPLSYTRLNLIFFCVTYSVYLVSRVNSK